MQSRVGRVSVGAAVGAILLGFVPVLPALTAHASQPASSSLVVATPATNTPNVLPGTFSDGSPYEVNAIAQVGGQIIMGGQFTSVIPNPGDTNSADAIPVSNIVAFDQASGTVNKAFAPKFTGGASGLHSEVSALLAGPVVAGDPTVYVGGAFKTVNGSSTYPYLVLLDATNGSIVTSFVPRLDGGVTAIKLAGSHLLLGGTFQHVASGTVQVVHDGLASLNPNTGALDPYMSVQLTGHHTYTGTAWCTPAGVMPTGCTSADSIDVSADGTRLIVDGDFKTASDGTGSYLRDQIVMIDLTLSGTNVDQTWATQEFDAGCNNSATSNGFDHWVRGLSFSPDGSYFVVTATGSTGTNADGTKGLCDSTSRWETTATGTNVQPTWVDWAGKDSFYSVAITASAVYVGGHERWVNNSMGADSPGEGAVPRPGVAALDPASGVPYAWNPGRTPRGAGTYSLLATAQGLYAGSDTALWGPPPNQSYRGMVAFFPTGGELLPSTATASIPANIYLAGPAGTTSLTEQYDSGTSFGPSTTVADPNALNWSQVRGAFMIGNWLFYGYSDGNFYRRTFDGTTLGPQTALDPAVGSYDDPIWDNIPAGGNGGYNYQGKLPTFYGTSGDIASVTGMVYWGGRLYYTLAGKKHLFYRAFTPDTGVVGADKCVWTSGSTSNNLEPCVFDSVSTEDFSGVQGVALSPSTNTLYYSDSSGNLHTVAWNGGNPDATTDQKVSGPGIDGRNWKSQGMFLLAPGAPTASFTPTCSYLTCSANASASAAPGSSISSYTWDFGDGSTPTTTTSPTTSHSYTNPGPYTITLTVTTAQGATASATQQVTTTAPPPPTAAFTPACAFLTCSLDATGSTSPGSSITSYTWDFGDGSTPITTTSSTTSYTYANPGPYTITLTVTNALGATASTTEPITASVPSAPTAVFTSTCTALACQFDGTSSSSPGSSITGYAWDFGDGDTSTAAQPSETFAGPGTYTVTLTVTNALNQTGTTTQSVTVAPAPVAAFAPSCTALGCTFDGSASSSNGSTISVYAWNFGDGTAGTAGSSPTTSHTYTTVGSYTVTLTVTDALGNTASTSQQVTVAPAPVASFIASCSQMTCSMDGTASTAPGSSIAAYDWTFGDGNTGTGATTSNTYTTPGTYLVKLTVTNALGTSSTTTEQVNPSLTASPVAFVGQAATSANATTETVTIPTTVKAGNGLVLIATSSVTTPQTAPAGWTQIGTATNNSNLISTIWQRVATSTDASSKVTVTFSTGQVKGTLQLLAYSGTSATGPIQTAAPRTGTTAISVTTPTVTVTGSGAWVTSYWAARTSTVTGWTTPTGQTVRGSATGSGGGYIISTATDTAAVVTPGTAGGFTATMAPNTATASGDVAWTIVLAPSP